VHVWILVVTVSCHGCGIGGPGSAQAPGFVGAEAVLVTVMEVVLAALGTFLVSFPVAVVVDAVTDFQGPRKDRGIPVITVSCHGCRVGELGHAKTHGLVCPETVFIQVEEVVLAADSTSLVSYAIAVVVDAVADLRGSRVGVGVVGIAVQPARVMTLALQFSRHAYFNRAVAVPTAIAIEVPVAGTAPRLLVDFPVAVVVSAIADFQFSPRSLAYKFPQDALLDSLT
jgi:hypothetical protein